MPGRKYQAASSSKYPFSINGQLKESDLNDNITTALYWEYDSRIGRRWNTDPLFKEYESPYSCFNNNPILSNDILGDQASNHDEDHHKVKKGETLSAISKKYGVSIQDLQKMNDIKDPNKIIAGQNLIINPETNFLNSPYPAEVTNNGINGQYSVVNNLERIKDVGLDFVKGKGSENTVYTGGGALNQVRTSSPVRDLVEQGMTALFADGKLKPGEVFRGSYDIGKIYGENGWRILWEQTKNAFSPTPNDNEGFYGAENVLGSFDISIRVKADGYTLAICVYDSKTIRSFTDGNAKQVSNRRNPMGHLPASNTYQRYLWDMVLCAPGINQKK